jgi:hypothetical protein
VAVDNLYYQTHPFTGSVSTGFSFDEQTVKDAIRRIYEKKFNPLTEIDEAVFSETWNLFNKATDEGFKKREYSDPDYSFYEEIRTSNAVFSAFRTHRLQNDIAAQLLDEKGNLKPFEQYLNDVQPIAGHNVRHWLRTEYDTAVIRAHRAADWRQFEEVKDILPNLRWMPTTSVTPDLVHKRYWEARLTLAQDHPFWEKHRPGDRWNCKCSLEATDDPVQGAHVLDGEDQPKPDKGLDNNPGKDAKLFSDTHPYIENAYKGAEKAVKDFISKKVLPLENFTKTQNMFKVYKKYKNGGEVLIHKQLSKKQLDYKMLLTTANEFAKQGKKVQIVSKLYYDKRGINDSSEYKKIFGKLIGTAYEGKSPDFIINGIFYELESYDPPFGKNKVSKMISRGTTQSSRIIINNTKGASDRFIYRRILGRLEDRNFKYKIDEIWLYEKGKIRLFFKKQ